MIKRFVKAYNNFINKIINKLADFADAPKWRNENE